MNPGEQADGAARDDLVSPELAAQLVDQVVDYAVIGLDTHGRIVTWNKGAARVKGYARDEIIGRHIATFYPPEDQAAGLPEDLLNRALRDGRVQHAGWRVRRDGSQFWGDVTITATFHPDGTHAGFTKVTRDMTAVHESEVRRQAFLATLAHDYRGPIYAISGYAEMIAETAGEEPAQQQRFAQRILENTQKLLSLTESLLELAHTETAEVSLAPVSLDALARARTNVESLGSLPGVERVQVQPGTCLVRADPVALDRIWTNLISNAVKYSDDGWIDVQAHAAGDFAILSVSDRGRGIHPEDVDTIFDAYERGRFQTEDGGLGLGLASVKRLTERMDGQVAINSEPEVGTTVSVALPAG
ncbi:MAG: PAS domain-containing sensor histidine kinase [Nocardioides sp.]|nr:PAS domain-containing sensor histidine kinase [Nocardioides sp.]